jgi:hypothetical protein
MSLPPLANVFSLRSENTRLIDEVERVVSARHPNRVVRRPASSWLVTVEGVPPLPLSLEDDADIFFTEGGDLFEDNERRTVARAANVSPSSLAGYGGDFGFLHIDSDDEAVFVRSCGGRAPVYVRRGRSYVALATLLTDLVALTPEELSLDPLTCAIWAMGQALFPDGRTFLRGVESIPAGHSVTITKDGRTRTERYWNPRPTSLSKPTEERSRYHVDRCRTLLLDYLSRELDPNGHNLLTLSGGVDSSSLAAVATGTLGFPVSTLSLVPRHEPDLNREMAYIENLRNNYRFERTWDFPLDYEGRVDASRSAPIVAFPVFHPALGLLPRILEDIDVSVLIGGEFADEVCGSPFTFPDWLRHTSALELARRRKEWPQGRRTAARWIKHRGLSLVRRPFLPIPADLPDYIRPAVREEYRQWRADRRRALARDNLALPYLAFQTEQGGFIYMNWEVTSVLGVRRAWPFVNRAMLELAFQCHPWELVGPSTKKLLRSALDGHVPAKNLYRTTRGHHSQPRPPRPAPPPVPGGEDVFEFERLASGEARLGVPISLLFRQFLGSVEALRKEAPLRGAIA